MKLHDLRPAPGAHKKPKRVGRGPGSGHGKTAGRGQKGQKARSGAKISPGFEGGQMPLQRRLPKRGFTNIFRQEYQVINVETLERKFADGQVVSLERLRELRLVKGKDTKVKILGNGELTKRLVVQAHKFSRQAKEKIEACGGRAEVV